MATPFGRLRSLSGIRPTTIAVVLIVAAWIANIRWAPASLVKAFQFSDVFADFVKLVLSYPGGSVHSSAMPELIARYSGGHESDLSGVIFTNPASVTYSHFAVPPLTTTIAVLSRAAISVVDPIWLFVGLAVAVEGYALAIALKGGRICSEKLALACTVGFAFSNIFMLARGNLYAGLCCALIIHSLVVLQKRPALAGVLLAVACNVRPNAIVFALPALALGWTELRRYGVALVTTGLVVFAVFLIAAHALYPDYSLTTFRTGLRIYNRTYVAGNEGMDGAAAIFAPLKLWFGYGPAALICLAATALFASFAYFNRNGPRSVVALLTCAAYVALTAALGDYHLTVFAAVPILATTDPKTWRVWLATLAAALVLAPMFFGGWQSHSVAAFIYPLLIVLSAGALVFATALTWIRLSGGGRHPIC